VLVNEEESASPEKTRLLVLLIEEILERKIRAQLRIEMHAHVREEIFTRNSVLRRRTELNR
jgi:hypothetical protein